SEDWKQASANGAMQSPNKWNEAQDQESPRKRRPPSELDFELGHRLQPVDEEESDDKGNSQEKQRHQAAPARKRRLVFKRGNSQASQCGHPDACDQDHPGVLQARNDRNGGNQPAQRLAPIGATGGKT